MRTRAGTIRNAALAAMLGAAMLTPGTPAGAGHAAGQSGYFDLEKLPAIDDVTGTQIFDGLKQFVADYPYRHTGAPTEILAGIELRDDMKALGYEVNVHSMASNGTGLVHDCADCPGFGLKAITAIKRGTTLPNEWIMVMGHYDTVPQTIYGAYDNGAGSNFIRYIAKELADVPTNRSVVFTWFNGEENGLLASEEYAAELKAKGQKIAMVLGFDMVGISYPVANPSSITCLCVWHGPANAYSKPMLEYVHHDYLGFPKGDKRLVEVGGVSTRNSDERSFANLGYSSLRWAGMRTAANYPAYHKQDDTIEKIIEVAGEGNYEKGIFNTLRAVYYTFLAVDNHAPSPSFISMVSGRNVSVDGGGSTDADGTLSSYSWSFGDGTTGTGKTASHTYSGPGTYTVTLTTADNLWPQVTRSVSTTVTVG